MEVWLVDEEWIDEKIPGTTAYSDADGNYEIPVTFTEFGMVKIHAETDSFLNEKSQSRTIFVLDMYVVGVILGVILFLWYLSKTGGKK